VSVRRHLEEGGRSPCFSGLGSWVWKWKSRKEGQKQFRARLAKEDQAGARTVEGNSAGVKKKKAAGGNLARAEGKGQWKVWAPRSRRPREDGDELKEV